MVTTSEPALEGRQAACMIVADGTTFCIDPLEDAIQIIGKRWALLVIGILGNRPGIRFGEAKTTIPGISARALSSALKDLQAHNLVTRHVDVAASPPAVSYELTAKGNSLRNALLPLLAWAQEPTSGPKP